MRSFAIVDGDLAISRGGAVGMVEGRDKLIQDLTIWMTEPFGIGPLSPGFGSLLPGMVGESDPASHLLEVQTEVARIAQLYQGDQMLALKEASASGTLRYYSRDEILNVIESVKANFGSRPDSVQATLIFQTASSAQGITLPLQVDENGAVVS